MEYRMLPHGGEKIGVLGMGSSVVGAQKEADIIKTVRAAFDLGVNYFDMAGGHATIFPAYGKALHDIRSQIYLQVHFGADYTTGEYGWTTELDEIKKSVDWQLKNLQTDYIDFGFIHCLDEEADLLAYEKNGVLKYLTDLQAQGVVHHLGLSSHTPLLANRVLDMKLIDMLMFSINPVYDYGKGDFGFGENTERYDLYCRCQREGVGISVMKPFCGGQLLDKKQSPFQAALTKPQCIAYALDKPSSLSFPATAANRSSARCSPTLKQARRRATIPPSLPLRPKTRSANVSTVSTATPVPSDSISRSSTSIMTLRSSATVLPRSTISRSKKPCRTASPAATATAAVPSASTSPSAYRKSSRTSASKNPSGLP